MRRLAAAWVVVVVSGWLAWPAHADEPTYLNESLLGLQSSPVYVSPQVGSVDSATVEKLEKTGKSDDIAFVVLPGAASSEASASKMVSDIAKGTSYDTVVVVIGNDIEAGSRVLPPGSANDVANEAEANAGNLDGALVTIADQLHASVAGEEPASPTGANDGGLPTSAFFAPLLIGAAVIAALMYLRRRNRQLASPDETPDELRTLTAQVRSNLDVIGRADPDFARAVDESLVKTGRLFWRLKQAQSGSIHQITSTYVGNLGSVLKGIETYRDSIVYPGDYNPGEPAKYARQIFTAYQEILDHNMLEATSGQVTQTKIASKLIETNVPIKFTDPLKERDRQ